jgi:hypothetical protein
MIELYDVIEALSTNVKTEKGILVLHRSMKVHPKFKVYKRFCYDLYLVKGKEKTLIFSFEEVKNTPADDLIKIWNECDKLYLKKLMGWVASNEYKAMMKDGIQ